MATILALDLSKKRTGYSVTRYDTATQTASFITSGVLLIPQQTNYSKYYFRAKTHLVELIAELVPLYGPFDALAFETPIFGHTSSELQFYLTQEVLNFAWTHNLDAVGYSPMLLKSFAKQWTTEPTSRAPDKAELYRIYADHVYPGNEGLLPHLDLKTSDDQVDAVYLGLMALLAQGALTDRPAIPTLTGHEDTWLTQHGHHYLFTENDALHRTFVAQGLTSITNLCLPKPEGRARPLTKFGQDLKRNEFLRLSMSFHYPFARLHGLAQICNQLAQHEQKRTIDLLTARLKKVELATLLNTRGRWAFGLDARGAIFLDPR